MNYKIGDHVVCEESNVPSWNYKGKTGVINRIDLSYEYPYRCTMDDGSAVSWCTVSGLVEEKKMFTKRDLKNGDVIVRRNGWVEIVIVDLDVLVSKNGWDSLHDIDEDLTDCDSRDYGDEYDIVKVYRPKERYHCGFNEDAYTKGTLVYDRERDTKKPLYNGKVVCVELNGNTMYTVGKIYQFKDGILTADNGITYPSRLNPIHNFEAWNKWTASKFIEIKE